MTRIGDEMIVGVEVNAGVETIDGEASPWQSIRLMTINPNPNPTSSHGRDLGMKRSLSAEVALAQCATKPHQIAFVIAADE
jgi:hypothetical protein